MLNSCNDEQREQMIVDGNLNLPYFFKLYFTRYGWSKELLLKAKDFKRMNDAVMRYYKSHFLLHARDETLKLKDVDMAMGYILQEAPMFFKN